MTLEIPTIYLIFGLFSPATEAECARQVERIASSLGTPSPDPLHGWPYLENYHDSDERFVDWQYWQE